MTITPSSSPDDRWPRAGKPPCQFDSDDARAGRCGRLQINCETLDEHQQRLVSLRMRPLTREEAASSFPAYQVVRHFDR